MNQTTDSTTWTWTAADSALDFLANGETLVVTYDISVEDDSGTGNKISGTRQIVVTVTGTNDTPVVNGLLANSVSDDFNGASLDASKWQVHLPTGISGADDASVTQTRPPHRVARPRLSADRPGFHANPRDAADLEHWTGSGRRR